MWRRGWWGAMIAQHQKVKEIWPSPPQPCPGSGDTHTASQRRNQLSTCSPGRVRSDQSLMLCGLPLRVTMATVVSQTVQEDKRVEREQRGEDASAVTATACCSHSALLPLPLVHTHARTRTRHLPSRPSHLLSCWDRPWARWAVSAQRPRFCQRPREEPEPPCQRADHRSQHAPVWVVGGRWSADQGRVRGWEWSARLRLSARRSDASVRSGMLFVSSTLKPPSVPAPHPPPRTQAPRTRARTCTPLPVKVRRKRTSTPLAAR